MKKALIFITPIVVFVLLGLFLFNKNKQKINFSEQLPIILTAIDQEIQLQESYGDSSRRLSSNLITKISRLANSLVPTALDIPSITLPRDLSPERGMLLTSLIDKKLNTSTYQEIFSIATFEKAFLEDTDLSNTILNNISLNQAYFNHVNLSGASLVGANLFKVHFQNVNLRGANLNKVNLREADLDGSNLSKANLTFGYLREAKLKGVHVENTIFTDANLAGVDLNQTAKGLGDND